MFKKLFVFAFVFLIAISAFPQPQLMNQIAGDYMTYGSWTLGNLPRISGTWFYVDGKDGKAAYSGRSASEAKLTLKQAYDLCTTGKGDGIVIIGRSISGTSYYTTLTSRIIWAKYGITVVGVGSGSVYNGQCRVTNPATATGGDSLAALIYVTGRYNRFIGITFINTADCQTYTALQTAQHTAIQIGGVRNQFINCHFSAYDVNTAGASTNTYAAYLTIGVWLRTGSDENEFVNCWVGNSSYDPGNTACSWIYLDGAAAQQHFVGCTFVQQVSAGTGFGGLESSAITTLNGQMFFDNCKFAIWRANTKGYISNSWFIGSCPTTGQILIKDCIAAGFTRWDETAANDLIWADKPAAAVAGGIGVATY